MPLRHRITERHGALTACLLMFAASCRVPGLEPQRYLVYTPYIESITAPAELTVGQQGVIVITASMEANPGVLSDPDFAWDLSGGISAGVEQMRLYAVEKAALGSAPPGPPGTTFELPLVFNTPGIYTFQFAGVAPRELGGLQTWLNSAPSFPPFPEPSAPNFEIHEIVITVRPD